MNKLMPIVIEETKRCDTRAIVKTFTQDDVEKDTKAHIKAVCLACSDIAGALASQSLHHDYTKLGDYLPMFYRALKTGFKDDEFKKLNWWTIHKTTERHHLNDYCPDDVDLIDVIEMVCDCVCAGMARSGSVYPIKISPEILEKAVANTQKMLEEAITVRKEEQK